MQGWGDGGIIINILFIRLNFMSLSTVLALYEEKTTAHAVPIPPHCKKISDTEYYNTHQDLILFAGDEYRTKYCYFMQHNGFMPVECGYIKLN